MTHHTTLDQQTLPEEKGSMDRLQSMLQKLPAGQRRVARALIAGDDAPTCQVASRLRLHRGTVSQQLRRMRLRDPPTYAALMEYRAQQLADRHQRALERAQEHSRRWHRAQARRRRLREQSERPMGY
jgi:hypothetical protein